MSKRKVDWDDVEKRMRRLHLHSMTAEDDGSKFEAARKEDYGRYDRLRNMYRNEAISAINPLHEKS